MNELKTFVSKVKVGPTICETSARVAYCSCGAGATTRGQGPGYFVVFQVAGQDHYHLQCAACDTSYCSFGKCGDPIDKK